MALRTLLGWRIYGGLFRSCEALLLRTPTRSDPLGRRAVGYCASSGRRRRGFDPRARSLSGGIPAPAARCDLNAARRHLGRPGTRPGPPYGDRNRTGCEDGNDRPLLLRLARRHATRTFPGG